MVLSTDWFYICKPVMRLVYRIGINPDPRAMVLKSDWIYDTFIYKVMDLLTVVLLNGGYGITNSLQDKNPTRD